MNREEGIKLIAYQIWEEEGCCHGNDVKHWLKAQTIWQERNEPAKHVTEINTPLRFQQTNAAGKTKPAIVLNTQQSKKYPSSKTKP
jgi:hypothetical protein